jgi:hypothetical protein
VVKVDLARVPIVETAVMQTTMIRDSITAYSTAVGPSSLFKNRFIFDAKFFIIHSQSPGFSRAATWNKTCGYRNLYFTAVMLRLLVLARDTQASDALAALRET